MITDTIHIDTKSGTLGGFCLVLMMQTNWQDLLHSMIIAAVGAGTSFTISFLLGKLTRKIR